MSLHMGIYLDNAATSYPKPDCVLEAMEEYFRHIGANSGRSAHRRTREASRLVFETRERIASLIGARDSSRVIFTLNATEALNLAILGTVRQGTQVVTTSMEHNSVMRPIRYLQEHRGVMVEIAPCSPEGMLDPSDLEKKLSKHTALIVVTSASNVTGTIMPIDEIANMAGARGIPLLVDGAQTVGIHPVNVEDQHLDMLAFSGHKGLMGPQGTGCLYLREGIEPVPLKYGGTGSRSEFESQPHFLPDRYESGTMNLIGIAGLKAAVDYVSTRDINRIREKERSLTERLLRRLNEMETVTIYGPNSADLQTQVVSLNIAGKSSSAIGDLLDRHFDIAVRCGLHCAPAAHRTIGTFPDGTVRAGLGYFNSEEDIDSLTEAISTLVP